jgi:hypothetical protein
LSRGAWVADLSCGSSAVLIGAVSELSRGFEFVVGCFGEFDAVLLVLLQRAWVLDLS